MCGRFVFFDVDKLSERFNLKSNIKLNLKPSYNITPTSDFPVIIMKDSATLEMMKWGLIPNWAKELNVQNQMINARAETLTVKPSFKNLIKSKRCLIPSNGFYEWKKEDNKKIPFFISFKNMELFSFAGLYDIWKDPLNNREYKSFTIITTKANSLISGIHDRMPVILKLEDEKIWLDNNIDDIKTLTNLLKPFDSDKMLMYRVSNKVNNPKNDFKELLDPIN